MTTVSFGGATIDLQKLKDSLTPPPVAPVVVTTPAQSPGVGILIPYYLYPNNPYTDATFRSMIATIRQYNTVPVMVILNPGTGAGGAAGGPGTVTDGNYAAAIRLLQGAGAKVLGYVSTAYGTRSSVYVKEDIDLWLSLYNPTSPQYPCGVIDGIFLDEMPYDTSSSNGVDYIELYRSYDTYIKGKGLAINVCNPGSNQQGAWYKADVCDVIVTWENSILPTEADLAGNYLDGHGDYYYRTNGVLYYGQPTLDKALFAMTRKYVGWIYITSDGGVNPWDTLPAYLNDLFALAADPGIVHPKAAGQADSVAADVPALVADVNALLAKLRTAGLMS